MNLNYSILGVPMPGITEPAKPPSSSKSKTTRPPNHPNGSSSTSNDAKSHGRSRDHGHGSVSASGPGGSGTASHAGPSASATSSALAPPTATASKISLPTSASSSSASPFLTLRIPSSSTGYLGPRNQTADSDTNTNTITTDTDNRDLDQTSSEEIPAFPIHQSSSSQQRNQGPKPHPTNNSNNSSEAEAEVEAEDEFEEEEEAERKHLLTIYLGKKSYEKHLEKEREKRVQRQLERGRVRERQRQQQQQSQQQQETGDDRRLASEIEAEFQLSPPELSSLQTAQLPSEQQEQTVTAAQQEGEGGRGVQGEPEREVPEQQSQPQQQQRPNRQPLLVIERRRRHRQRANSVDSITRQPSQNLNNNDSNVIVSKSRTNNPNNSNMPSGVVVKLTEPVVFIRGSKHTHGYEHRHGRRNQSQNRHEQGQASGSGGHGINGDPGRGGNHNNPGIGPSGSSRSISGPSNTGGGEWSRNSRGQSERSRDRSSTPTAVTTEGMLSSSITRTTSNSNTGETSIFGGRGGAQGSGGNGSGTIRGTRGGSRGASGIRESTSERTISGPSDTNGSPRTIPPSTSTPPSAFQNSPVAPPLSVQTNNTPSTSHDRDNGSPRSGSTASPSHGRSHSQGISRLSRNLFQGHHHQGPHSPSAHDGSIPNPLHDSPSRPGTPGVFADAPPFSPTSPSVTSPDGGSHPNGAINGGTISSEPREIPHSGSGSSGDHGSASEEERRGRERGSRPLAEATRSQPQPNGHHPQPSSSTPAATLTPPLFRRSASLTTALGLRPNHSTSRNQRGEGGDHDDGHPPAVLRGLLVMTLGKPTRIKKIGVRLKGTCTTHWPEGIGARRLDVSEETPLIDQTWVYFDALSEPLTPPNTAQSTRNNTATNAGPPTRSTTSSNLATQQSQPQANVPPIPAPPYTPYSDRRAASAEAPLTRNRISGGDSGGTGGDGRRARDPDDTEDDYLVGDEDDDITFGFRPTGLSRAMSVQASTRWGGEARIGTEGNGGENGRRASTLRGNRRSFTPGDFRDLTPQAQEQNQSTGPSRPPILRVDTSGSDAGTPIAASNWNSRTDAVASPAYEPVVSPMESAGNGAGPSTVGGSSVGVNGAETEISNTSVASLTTSSETTPQPAEATIPQGQANERTQHVTFSNSTAGNSQASLSSSDSGGRRGGPARSDSRRINGQPCTPSPATARSDEPPPIDPVATNGDQRLRRNSDRRLDAALAAARVTAAENAANTTAFQQLPPVRTEAPTISAGPVSSTEPSNPPLSAVSVTSSGGIGSTPARKHKHEHSSSRSRFLPTLSINLFPNRERGRSRDKRLDSAGPGGGLNSPTPQTPITPWSAGPRTAANETEKETEREERTNTLSRTKSRSKTLKSLKDALLGDDNDDDSDCEGKGRQKEAKQPLLTIRAGSALWREFRPGTYTYAISIPIPADLPPSIRADFGSVEYKLNGFVRRAGALTPNLNHETEVQLVTTGSDDDNEVNESIVVERFWETQMRYFVAISGKSFPMGGKMPLTLRLDPLSNKIKVYRISAVLEEKVDYFAQGVSYARHEGLKRYPLFKAEYPPELRRPILPILDASENALQSSPLNALFINATSADNYTPSLLDPDGPWELQTELEIPDCFTRLHLSFNHDQTPIHISHVIRIIIRVERGDDSHLDSKGRRKLWDVIIEAPIKILSCRCNSANQLPAYSSSISQFLDGPACPCHQRNRTQPFFEFMNRAPTITGFSSTVIDTAPGVDPPSGQTAATDDMRHFARLVSGAVDETGTAPPPSYVAATSRH